MGDFSEFLESWESTPSAPVGGGDSFADFVEAWGQNPAPMPSPSPSSQVAPRPTYRPAPRPSPQAGPPPEDVPWYRLRLREMGHPRWETMMAPEAKAFFDETERATAAPGRPSGRDELRAAPGVIERLKRWGRNMASHPDAMFDPNQNPAAVVFANKPVAAAMSAMDLATGWPSRIVGSLVERGAMPGLDDLFGQNFQQTPTADRAVTNAVATSPLYRSVMNSAFGRAMVTNPIIGVFGDPETVAAIPPAVAGTAAEVLLDPDTILTGAIGEAGARPGRVAAKLASPEHLQARAAPSSPAIQLDEEDERAIRALQGMSEERRRAIVMAYMQKNPEKGRLIAERLGYGATR